MDGLHVIRGRPRNTLATGMQRNVDFGFVISSLVFGGGHERWNDGRICIIVARCIASVVYIYSIYIW